MTTIASFVSTVAGLTVTGVNRSYTYLPATLGAALPASFVDLPAAGRNAEFASTCVGGGKTRTVQLVVCIEAINQDRAPQNYAATVTMMDNMETALDALRSTSPMIIDYEISAGARGVGDTTYWSAIATVTGTDV